MREDMHEVLIERPRRGWRVKTDRSGKPWVGEWNGEEGFERCYRPRRQQTKHFDDHLSPLRRWLRKQVGRPWSKVWSELCAGIDSRTTVGQHLMSHARDEVNTQCELDGRGGLRTLQHHWRRGSVDGWAEPEGLYVHPGNGLLCYRVESWRGAWRRVEPAPPPGVLVLDATRCHVKRNGIWYEATYSEAPVVRGKRVDPDFTWRYRNWVLGRCRQLSHRALREAGLQNDS